MPISERAMVKLIVLDYSAVRGYSATLLYLASDESTDTSTARGIPYCARGTGDSIEQALEQAEQASGKLPFYAQNEMLLVSPVMLRKEMTEVVDFFSRETFSRTNMAVFCSELALSTREKKAEELLRLTDQLATLTAQQDVVVCRVYDFEQKHDYKIPMIRLCADAVREDGVRVLPMEGSAFALSEEQCAVARLLWGESKSYVCHTLDTLCSIENIALTHEVVERDGMLFQRVRVRGALTDYHGKLSVKKLKQAAEREVQEAMIRLYEECYLERRTDIFCFNWWFRCHQNENFSVQIKSQHFYRPSTVQFESSFALR